MTIDAPKQFNIPALRALWQEAFGDSDEFLNFFENTAFAFDRCRCAATDHAVAAALYWFDCICRGQRVAYIYAVATAKAYRGQGLCTALMEDTHRHLKALGYVGAVLVPGSESLFEFYKKIGYQVCSGIGEILCTPSTENVEIRKIDTDEYSQLRRKLLPAGGVIQENENLRFLQAQAEFYAGDGFLLVARCENNTLYGTELLGDTDKAPAILNTLRVTEGRFRVQGNDKPFAMYYALCDTEPPEYFGLAFD